MRIGKMVTGLVMGALLMMASNAVAEGEGAASMEGVSTQTVQKVQTTCPVMGGKIDKKLFADYDGKRVYFCCGGCSAVFNKDPAKYIKKMEGEGITLDKTPVEPAKKDANAASAQARDPAPVK
jgi:YHS domain-containing protein